LNEGWLPISEVKVTGYEFEENHDGGLIIRSYRWSDGITVWDTANVGRFDLQGNFIPYEMQSLPGSLAPAGCWGIWNQDMVPSEICP
jgi:hypothetical protein